jgi:hypothetical protein
MNGRIDQPDRLLECAWLKLALEYGALQVASSAAILLGLRFFVAEKVVFGDAIPTVVGYGWRHRSGTFLRTDAAASARFSLYSVVANNK